MTPSGLGGEDGPHTAVILPKVPVHCDPGLHFLVRLRLPFSFEEVPYSQGPSWDLYPGPVPGALMRHRTSSVGSGT